MPESSALFFGFVNFVSFVVNSFYITAEHV